MEPIELTISDGEATYVLQAFGEGEHWRPRLFDLTSGRRVAMWPVGFRSIEIHYGKAWDCLNALFFKVTTELFGIRA